jgi:hypothetical protein
LTVDDAPDGILNTVAPVYGEIVTIPLALACYRLHGANRWASNGSDPSRLPKRIRDRQDEVTFMRRRAEQRGVQVPAGNVLDHELAFINYRLMALRLGLEYDGSVRDTPLRLLWRAWAAVRDSGLSLRMNVAHMLWFGVLSIAPESFARKLYSVRANRSALGQTARQELGALLARATGADKASS